jgi:hypothetical protein
LGKTPLRSLQSPLGCSQREIERILPCIGLRLLLKSACRRRPRHRRSYFQGRVGGLTCLAHDGTRGSHHPNSRPRVVAACPSAPTLIRSSTGLPVPHSVYGRFHDTSPSVFSCLPCSVFSDEPGRGLKHRRRQWPVRCAPWLAYRTFHCRRTKGLRDEDRVPCDLALVTTPRSPSCGAACPHAPRLDV